MVIRTKPPNQAPSAPDPTDRTERLGPRIRIRSVEDSTFRKLEDSDPELGPLALGVISRGEAQEPKIIEETQRILIKLMISRASCKTAVSLRKSEEPE